MQTICVHNDDEYAQGFNAVRFIRQAQCYKTYQTLGIKRLMVYVNDVLEFEIDEPGRMDA